MNNFICCSECGDIYRYDELDKETGYCKECYEHEYNSLDNFIPKEEPI